MTKQLVRQHRPTATPSLRTLAALRAVEGDAAVAGLTIERREQLARFEILQRAETDELALRSVKRVIRGALASAEGEPAVVAEALAHVAALHAQRVVEVVDRPYLVDGLHARRFTLRS